MSRGQPSCTRACGPWPVCVVDKAAIVWRRLEQAAQDGAGSGCMHGVAGSAMCARSSRAVLVCAVVRERREAEGDREAIEDSSACVSHAICGYFRGVCG